MISTPPVSFSFEHLTFPIPLRTVVRSLLSLRSQSWPYVLALFLQFVLSPFLYCFPIVGSANPKINHTFVGPPLMSILAILRRKLQLNERQISTEPWPKESASSPSDSLPHKPTILGPIAPPTETGTHARSEGTRGLSELGLEKRDKAPPQSGKAAESPGRVPQQPEHRTPSTKEDFQGAERARGPEPENVAAPGVETPVGAEPHVDNQPPDDLSVVSTTSSSPKLVPSREPVMDRLKSPW